MLSEPEKAKTEENQGDNSSENGNGKEKIRIESPVLTGFDYQEASGLGTSTQPLTSTASSLTGFSNWSAAIAPSSSTIINEDASFFHQGGVPTASANNGALLFQNFPHHVSPGFGGSFSPQIGPLSQHHPHHPHFQHHHNQHQQQRRSPASPHPPPFTHRNAAFNQLPHLANNLNKPPSPWSSYQSPSPTPSSWSPGGGGYGGWGGSQGRDHRRGLNGGITPLNSISPLKKNFASNHIQLQKYARPSSAFAPKSWMDDSLNRADNIFPFQDRTRTFDMHSLENSLIDIMRAENDSLKGQSSLFPMEDGFLDDGRGDQSLHSGLGSPHCFSHQNGERVERYSRKVFVGGLPPDIDEDEITASFRRFGPLIVDWPHKAESKSYFPPKGYAFLLFQDESSVQALIDACIEEDGKLYLCVSSPTIKDKPVQIRPWNLSDSDFVMDGSQPLDPRKTIFVGGVPRPLRAVELAMIMDRLYGGVCYAGIDTDPELKYPKGAGRVAFSNQQSYIAAISARFVQLQHGEIDKRVAFGVCYCADPTQQTGDPREAKADTFDFPIPSRNVDKVIKRKKKKSKVWHKVWKVISKMLEENERLRSRLLTCSQFDGEGSDRTQRSQNGAYLDRLVRIINTISGVSGAGGTLWSGGTPHSSDSLVTFLMVLVPFPVVLVPFPVVLVTFPVVLVAFPVVLVAFPVVLVAFLPPLVTFPVVLVTFPVVLVTFPPGLVALPAFWDPPCLG
ncbi:hypothetical protein HGM15179_014233 [Zosterops borbonicus]|uniref:RRM domain-containing protein n=1 Tax=Zosterops borbonicus TaxID=364589 RepID=A0A8K1G705_9PASS|nr:hypothetical protein HGM15179_014233 [Zosterops borbonicus]